LKQKVPLTICFIAGVFFMLQYFLPFTDSIFDLVVTKWMVIIAGFVIFIGIYSLIRVHVLKIRRKIPGWGYSIVTICGVLWMMFVGFTGGMEAGTLYQKTFFMIQAPIQQTMMSLLAFYMASAAFRSFRMRNLEAGLLLVAAIIVMIGQVPVGASTIPGIAWLKEWILNNPNLAAKRGIMMGIGLGMISTSLKIILGIERSYLSGG
jgi:hypothetical protein